MKLAIILLCLFALTFAQDETIEIPGSECSILRFGREVEHRHRPRHHCRRGTCGKGLYCVKKRCTDKCPFRRHRHRPRGDPVN